MCDWMLHVHLSDLLVFSAHSLLPLQCHSVEMLSSLFHTHMDTLGVLILISSGSLHTLIFLQCWSISSCAYFCRRRSWCVCVCVRCVIKGLTLSLTCHNPTLLGTGIQSALSTGRSFLTSFTAGSNPEQKVTERDYICDDWHVIMAEETQPILTCVVVVTR